MTDWIPIAEITFSVIATDSLQELAQRAHGMAVTKLLATEISTGNS